MFITLLRCAFYLMAVSTLLAFASSNGFLTMVYGGVTLAIYGLGVFLDSREVV